MGSNGTAAITIGKQLVTLCQIGKSEEAVETLYDEKIVSIEAASSDEMPARIEGIEAVKGKTGWWYDNHVIHDMTVVGPFCGDRDDQFIVGFELDATFKPSGERSQMSEVGLYTVSNDKIVQEEFLSRVD